MHVAKMHYITGIASSDKIPSVESHVFCLQEYLACLGWCYSNDPEHSTSTIIALLTLRIIPSTLLFLESIFSQLRKFPRLLSFYSRSSIQSLCCCESSFLLVIEWRISNRRSASKNSIHQHSSFFSQTFFLTFSATTSISSMTDFETLTQFRLIAASKSPA